jgi:hypothetical protein
LKLRGGTYENTGIEALTSNDPAQFKVTTVARGSLAVHNLHISSPPGARDNELSTGQDFIVSDSLHWTNAAQLSVQLVLPVGFSADNAIQSLVNVDKTGSAKLSWRVRASSQPVSNAEIRVVFSANDASNDTSALRLASNAIRLNVVKRADPQLRVAITKPTASQRGVVSIVQPFEVTVTIENKGEAGLIDSATVKLDLARTLALGYSLLDPQERTTKTSTNFTFSWWLRGRQDISTETDLIPFTLELAPSDTNTNQAAISTLSQVMLAVRTEGRSLVVETLEKVVVPYLKAPKTCCSCVCN